MRTLSTIIFFSVLVALVSGCKEYDWKTSRMFFTADSSPVFNEQVEVKAGTENKQIKALAILWKKQPLPVTIIDSVCFNSATIGESCDATLQVNFKTVFDTAGFDYVLDGKKVMTGPFKFTAKTDGSVDGKMVFESSADGVKFKIEITLNPQD